MSSTHKYLLDENLPSKAIKPLIAAGYAMTSVALLGLSGQPDHQIFRYARSHDLVIVTADSDFLHATNFPPPHPGIVVLQFPHKTRIAEIIATLTANLPALDALTLKDHIHTLDPAGVQQVF
jgi:predicted nuclease of predicted toxin-antitoxin system